MAATIEFITAPSGTQKRTSDAQNWQTANVGDFLYEGYQARNIEGNTYRLRLHPDTQAKMEEAATMKIHSFSGEVYYKDENQEWHKVTATGEYLMLSCQTEGTPSSCELDDMRDDANKIESDGVDVRT